MRTFIAIVMAVGLMAAAAFAQPVITQVSNAASNALAPLPNSSLAPGSYIAIYGTNIGPATSATWNPYPLPTTLGGVTISVTVNGTTVAAYPEFVSAGQVNAVLPSNTPIGTGTLTVTLNGTASNAFNITTVPASFGTFSWNAAGTGPGILTNAVTYAFITPFASVKPTTTAATGDYVTIWGTGLGAVDPSAEQTGPPPFKNLCDDQATCPTVWVGNTAATVTFAGRGGFTAEDQINFIVPAGAQGCYVQVAVQVGSVVSNVTSMSVDPGGATCSDADGIDYADVASIISSNGSAKVNATSLLSNYLNLQVLGSPFSWDNDTVNGEIATFTGYDLDAFQGFTLAPSVNNCTVSPFLKYPPPVDPILSAITYLDAGSSLSITGPNGTAQVPKNTNGKGYSAIVGGASINDLLIGGGIPPYFLNPANWGTSSWTYQISSGNYTLSGSGGADVGAFSGTIPVSSAAASFAWTNPVAVGGTIPRNTPLTINWTGGDPNGFVDITLISSTVLSGLPTDTTPGILVECMAPAGTGTFTVPTFVLSALPSTSGSAALQPPGEILVGPASGAVKISPPGTGLDAAYLFYHFISGNNVTWQ